MKKAFLQKEMMLLIITAIILTLFSPSVYSENKKYQMSINDNSWRNNSVYIDNLNNSRKVTIGTDNFSVISPVNNSTAGTILYKFNVTPTQEFSSFLVKYTGRAIAGSSVEFYWSADNVNFTMASRISRSDTLPVDDGDLNLLRTIDLSASASCKNVFYIKIVILSNYDTWGCVRSLSFDTDYRNIAPEGYNVFNPDFSTFNANDTAITGYSLVSGSTLNASSVLTSANPGIPGYVIYTVNAGSRSVFSALNFSYRARAIRDSYINISISRDSKNYTLIEKLMTPAGIYPDNDPGASGTGDVNLLRTVSVSSALFSGADSISVKIEIYSVSDTWACLKNLYIATNSAAKNINFAAPNMLTIGDSDMEASRNLTIQGNVERQSIDTSAGSTNKTYQVLNFSKANDTVIFTLDISNMTTADITVPVLLEITEIHAPGNAFGYKVYINNTPVYFRSYEPIISAPNTYFIPFYRSLLGSSNTFQVKIINSADTSFSISRVRAYGDFYTLAKEQGYYGTKMGIYEYVDTNLAAAENVAKKYSYMKNFLPGVTFGIPYMKINYQSAKSLITSFMNFSSSYSKTPVSIMQSRWWGHTAFSPDGIGGYFGDLKYGQITYDSQSGQYSATTPNQWGSTVWPTMSNSLSNGASVNKLIVDSAMISKEFALALASGSNIVNPMSLIMEWGSGYWNNGDFSDETISLAKKDGILLNPEDGLSFFERMWLIQNCAIYNEALAKGYRQGLETNAVTVRQNVVSYPSFQFSDYLFSHVSQSDIYPSNSETVPLWTSGVTNFNNPSSEMYSFSDIRNFEYSRSYGLLSCVNLEMTMLTKNSFESYVKSCYANGMGFLTMFNADRFDGEETALYDLSSVDTLPAISQIPYNRTVADIDYLRDYRSDIISAPNNPIVYSYSNVVASSDGFIKKASASSTGNVILKVTDANNFASGLKLYLQAKTLGNGTINISCGNTPSCRTPVGSFTMGEALTWFNSFSENTIDLSTYAGGLNTLYIKLSMSSGDINTSSIKTIKALIPWTDATGTINGPAETIAEQRAQNVFIQNESVAEKALFSYLKKQGFDSDIYNTVRNYFMIGRYRDCIDLLTSSSSELLPAKYAVEEYGTLGKYPIDVSLETGTPAVITLESYSSSETVFSVYSNTEQNITFTFRNAIGNYKLKKLSNNQFSLTKTSDWGTDIYTAVNNAVTFSVSTADVLKKMLPPSIEGVFKGRTSTDISIAVQDPSIGEYAESVSIPLASSCTYQRKKYGTISTATAYPSTGDKITLTVNSSGQVTAVLAEYGTYTGKIVSYVPPTLKGTHKTNGLLSMDNGMTYELSFNKDYTTFNTATLSGLAATLSLDRIASGIKIGSVYTVNYTPYSFNGSLMRLMRISQAVSTILNQTYENSDWAMAAYSASNLTVQNLDTNNVNKVLVPLSTSQPGTIVYKLTNAGSNSDLGLYYSGRGIMNDSCKVKVYYSSNASDYVLIDELNQYNYSGDFNYFRSVPITNYAYGTTSFYLKFEIYSTYQSWGCINDIQVYSATNSKPDYYFTNYRVTNDTINNITPQTSVSDFKANLNPSASTAITVQDSTGKTLSSDDPIGTGSTVIVTSSAGTATYHTLIYGDIDGDGMTSTTDLIKMKNILLKKDTLTGFFQKASFINSAVETDICGLLSIKAQILGDNLINQDP